jgi:hypothetical protein
MTESLGKLLQVNPRTIWPNEATVFTPWLADNIQDLAAALGLELEVENTEVAVGPYSADIVARDAGTGRRVVIENQLEKTDHDHLGKCLTYSAVLDASSVIWVSPKFTDEHRKTLDWLNDHTSSDLSFYGVTIELWKIDESNPALRFDVVSHPAEIVRQADISARQGELSEARRAQLAFWTEFRNRLEATGKVPSVQSPRPQYWFAVSLGRSGVVLSNTANTDENRIGVRVYISNRVADSVLPQLLDMKEDIEKELGFELLWNPNPENRDKTIGIYRNADIADSESRDKSLDWLVETTVNFREAFAPRIRGMDFGSSPREME